MGTQGLDDGSKTDGAERRAVRALTDVTRSVDGGELLVVVGMVQPLE